MVKLVTPITIMDYEKEISSYYPDFYKSIQSIIDLMPDFRPLNTIQRMKRVNTEDGEWVPEPQNPWRILYEEFEAMSYKKEDAELFQVIYTGDISSLDKILEVYDHGKEFAYTYPGLLWSLTQLGSSIAVDRFIMYIGFLDDRSYPFFENMIEKKIFSEVSSLLPYIREKETAQRIYDKFYYNIPYLSGDMIDKISKGDLGLIYWFTVVMERSLQKTFYAYDIVEKAISFSSTKAIRMLLESPIYDVALKRFPNCILRTAIENKNVDIFSLLYRDKRNSLKSTNLLYAAEIGNIDILKVILSDTRNNEIITKSSSGLLNTAISTRNFPLLEMFLYDTRIDPSDYQNNAFCMALHTKETEFAKRFLLSPRFRPMNMDSRYMGILFQQENKELLEMVLSHPNTRKEEYEELKKKYMKEEGGVLPKIKNYMFESFIDLIVHVTYK